MTLVQMEIDGKKLPPLLPWQAEFVSKMRTFNIIEAGRRSGKTTLACWLALREALRGGQVWWVSATHEMAKRGWEEILVPMARDFGGRVQRKNRIVLFPGGGTVQSHSADRPDNLVGSGLSAIILDEADHPSLDRRLLSGSLLPALVDRGGWLLLISAPFPGGGNGWFSELLQYALKGEDPDWFAMRVSSSANILLPQAHMERVRRAMEILDPASSHLQFDIMASRNRRAVFINPARFTREVKRVEGPVEMGLDIGGLHDPTAVVLIDRPSKTIYLAETLPPGLTTRELLEEIALFLQHHPIHAICLERNGVGGAVLPELWDRFGNKVAIIDVFMNADLKLSLTVQLHDALEGGELFIAPIPELIAVLESIDLVRQPSGRAVPRSSLPQDDLFSATLLAFYAHQAALETIGF